MTQCDDYEIHTGIGQWYPLSGPVIEIPSHWWSEQYRSRSKGGDYKGVEYGRFFMGRPVEIADRVLKKAGS